MTEKKPAPRKTRSKTIKAKTPNSSTSLHLAANSSYNLKTFLHPEAHMLYPGRDAFRDRLFHTMLIESQNPKMLHVMSFCIKYGMTHDTLANYCKPERDPELAQMFAHFKRCIAHNRRVGAMNFEINGAYITAGIEKLDPDEKESMEWRASLTAKAQAQEGGFIYVPLINGKLPDPEVIPKEEQTYDCNQQTVMQTDTELLTDASKAYAENRNV